MITQAHQNANGSVIVVTNTATLLYSLINTAASTTLPRAGFDVDCNGVDLIVENGIVRALWDGNTPTSSKGVLLSRGVHRLRNIDLLNLRLIRVSGANVSVGVTVGKCNAKEESNIAIGYDVPTSIIAGQKTVDSAGTAEALGSATNVLGFVVKALPSNEGNIYFGNSDVDKDNNKQFILKPGEQLPFPIYDLSICYIDVDTNDEGICYIGAN